MRQLLSYPISRIVLAFVAGVAAVALVAVAGLEGTLVFIGAFVAVLLGAQILRTPALGVTFILFFLPFERLPSIDIAGITVRPNFFFGAVTLLAFAIAWVRSRRPLAPNPIRLPFYSFLAIAFLSATQAVEERRAILTLAFILFTASFEFLVVNAIQTASALRRAIVVLWWSAFIVGIFGIYQFLGDIVGLPPALTGLRDLYTKEVFGFPRVQAFSIEPLYLGNYLLLPLSLLGASLLGRVRDFSRPALWFLFGLLGTIFILTLSRGAYLAAAVAVLVLVTTKPKAAAAPRNLLAALLIGCIALAGAAAFVSQGEGDPIGEFVEHASLGDLNAGDSTQGRIGTYRLALDAWDGARFFGIGPGNFGPFAKGYPDPATVADWPIVNNEYLELLAETGALGLGAILVLYAVVLLRSLKAYQATEDELVRAALLGGVAAFLGTLVQYNFFSSLYIIHIWVLIGFLVAAQNVAFGLGSAEER
ncbi:MAG: O-antigen ligase family protein [Patescibacteria group bacterium]|jgi:putative inorganic carbon (HCO3(-)) transporter